ncbi:MAG: SPOR domain-containing protein [Pseudomonadales bacterium]|nr:SPOR domain-containing protein [Pseudomonadales bacterium]
MAHDFASKRGKSQKKHSPKAKTKFLPKPSARTLLSVLALLGFCLGLYFLSGVTPEATGTPSTPQSAKANPSIPSPAQERLSAEPEQTENTYTFYEKLKEMQSWEPRERVEIREPKKKETLASKNKTQKSKKIVSTNNIKSPVAGKKYILQAGSYSSFSDANSQRVHLIINGIHDTKINTVTLANGKVGHRIEVGPFSSQQDIQKAKKRLAKLNVSSFSRTVK